MAKVSVLGAGSWGTALAVMLHGNHHQVTLWSALSDEVAQLRRDREQKGKLPGVHIPEDINITDCLEEYFGSNPNDPLAMLNDEGKQKVLSYIDLLIHPVSYVKETNVISYPAVPTDEPAMARIRLYDARVSAGHGDFLDSDYYTTIEVPARDAKGANFAVTISGDSMEPAFHDHDMVYVHQQETLDDGEIGIFSLNDNAYIKKLKNDSDGTFLMSLNQKYAPIPVHLDRDDFRIFGKVCRATR